MKWHLTKEQCFESEKLHNKMPEGMRAAFYAGWYAAGDQINNGYDSDDLQENLKESDFLEPLNEFGERIEK